jgi:hypothetical protein
VWRIKLGIQSDADRPPAQKRFQTDLTLSCCVLSGLFVSCIAFCATPCRCACGAGDHLCVWWRSTSVTTRPLQWPLTHLGQRWWSAMWTVSACTGEGAGIGETEQGGCSAPAAELPPRGARAVHHIGVAISCCDVGVMSHTSTPHCSVVEGMLLEVGGLRMPAEVSSHVAYLCCM